MPTPTTLGEILENPELIFAEVRKLFPKVNWEQVELDGPDLQDAIRVNKLFARDRDHIWNLAMNSKGTLEDLVHNCYQMYRQRYPVSDSLLVQVANAVEFTTGLFMIFSLLGVLCSIEPEETIEDAVIHAVAHFDDPMHPPVGLGGHRLFEIPPGFRFADQTVN